MNQIKSTCGVCIPPSDTLIQVAFVYENSNAGCLTSDMVALLLIHYITTCCREAVQDRPKAGLGGSLWTLYTLSVPSDGPRTMVRRPRGHHDHHGPGALPTGHSISSCCLKQVEHGWLANVDSGLGCLGPSSAACLCVTSVMHMAESKNIGGFGVLSFFLF